MIEIIAMLVAAVAAGAAALQQACVVADQFSVIAAEAQLNISRRPPDPHRPKRCAYCGGLREPRTNCPNCGAGDDAWRHREASQ